MVVIFPLLDTILHDAIPCLMFDPYVGLQQSRTGDFAFAPRARPETCSASNILVAYSMS